jgi:hypothetical protein
VVIERGLANLRGNPALRENRPIVERKRSVEKMRLRLVDRGIGAHAVMVSSPGPLRAGL